jgi:hypothetical protein
MKVTGSCHCGAIAYEAEVEPGTIGLCHCADCQKLTGSAFRANVQAPAAGFRLLRGTPRRYIKTADSGNKRCHAFCGDCGGPVYASALEDPPTYSLRLGALDQRYDLGAPARQIWTERRLAWVCELADVPEGAVKMLK